MSWAEDFVKEILPVFHFFSDRRVVFETERTNFGSILYMSFAYRDDEGGFSGPYIRLVKMVARGGWDIRDFIRVVKMIAQQWRMENFDMAKADCLAVNGGTLPRVLKMIFPDKYPDFIQNLYNPWDYTDWPDGGFLHNNPLMYPIQNRPVPKVTHLTTLSKWKSHDW